MGGRFDFLGRRYDVLDGGFVIPLEAMGDEGSIVDAARVSYGRGTRRVSDDVRLLRYLMRHEHWTPFEMCEIKFHVRVPMDCWRQWIRHRTASVNEYSTRYSEAPEDFFSTDAGGWRLQSSSNKQGSCGFLDSERGGTLSYEERLLHDMARRVYRKRLEFGVAREQARKDLPLSVYTEAYWKMDLRNLLHFLRLRLDAAAQQEIRIYAGVVADVVKEWVPNVWGAFEEYALKAVTLSGREAGIVAALFSGGAAAVEKFLEGEGSGAAWASNGGRELSEFESKLRRLGLYGAWTDVKDAMAGASNRVGDLS